MVFDAAVRRVGDEQADLPAAQGIGFAQDFEWDLERVAIVRDAVDGPHVIPRRHSAAQVVFQRVDTHLVRLGVACLVPAGIEERAWIATLARTRLDVVAERIAVGRRDVAVAGEIPGAIEDRIGVVALPRAGGDVMDERVATGTSDVRVSPRVPFGPEQRAGAPSFHRTGLDVVLEWVDAMRHHIGVSGLVEAAIEQRIRLPAPAPIVGEVIDQRVRVAVVPAILRHEPAWIEERVG